MAFSILKQLCSKLNGPTLLKSIAMGLTVGLFINSNPAFAYINNNKAASAEIIQFCTDLSAKLRTVKYDGCMALGLQPSHRYTIEDRPLVFKEYTPKRKHDPIPLPKGKVLFIGGVHGDEYAAISLTYLWMQSIQENINKTQHHWLFLPLANPDGLFESPATRPNANGVDINRNFPTLDWYDVALDTWRNHYKKNPRRFPGHSPNSEIETQWLVDTIERFQPDAIISVHAPYNLLDYDGPEHATPNQIGHLKHRELGTYPGSLGRYAGENLQIPVLTLELKSAGSMPNKGEIVHMWQDLERWAQTKVERKERDF